MQTSEGPMTNPSVCPSVAFKTHIYHHDDTEVKQPSSLLSKDSHPGGEPVWGFVRYVPGTTKERVITHPCILDPTFIRTRLNWWKRNKVEYTTE